MIATKKSIATGAALAGAGALLVRTLGPKAHEHCTQACREMTARPEGEEPRTSGCSMQGGRHAT